MWLIKHEQEEEGRSALMIQRRFRIRKASRRVDRKRHNVMLQRELEERNKELEKLVVEKSQYFEQALEAEKTRAKAVEEKARLDAETRVREQTRVAKDALDKLRALEEVRSSEVRMLEHFRKKERDREEKEKKDKEENGAAGLMQKLARGRKARQTVKSMRTLREEAAITITYFVYACGARRTVGLLREEKDSNNAATMLQCKIRQRTASQELERRQIEQRRIQEELAEAERAIEADAASKMQSKVRGWEARKKVRATDRVELAQPTYSFRRWPQ
jgi:hypothetical protein